MILALLAAVLARFLSPRLPPALALRTGSEAVSQLLGILTSSMLAGTTFSLSFAVSAFASAAGGGAAAAAPHDPERAGHVPRAFLFGLVGLVALHDEFCGASGKAVVFRFTIPVIGLVVVAPIGWIGHLMQAARMGDTLDRGERTASDALLRRRDHLFRGGWALCDAPPATLLAADTGYIRHVDMPALGACGKARAPMCFFTICPAVSSHPACRCCRRDHRRATKTGSRNCAAA